MKSIRSHVVLASASLLCAASINLAQTPAPAAPAAAAPAPATQQPAVVAGAFRMLGPVRLFPDGAPGMEGWGGRIATPVTETAAGGGATLFNITDPSYTAFLPDPARNTRTAVVIAPGGGFRQLSIESEGNAVARWLAERGVAAFVVKYRLVQQPGPNFSMMARMQEVSMDVSGALAIIDTEQALKLIRRDAAQYNIDPQKLVLVGFSAGAHVAAHLALRKDVALRPNYVAPIYGAPFGEVPPIPASSAADRLPPMFLAMAQDDQLVGAQTRAFYDALFQAGYRPELHLFMSGGHGFGMNVRGNSSDHFIDSLFWWMEAQDLTQKPGDPARRTGRGGGRGARGGG